MMPAFLSPKRRLSFILLLLLSFGQVAIGVTAANAVSLLFRQIERGDSPAAVLVALLLVAIVAGMVVEIFRRRVTESLGLGFATEVRLLLFERLLRRPFSGSRRRSHGATLLPFVGDLTALRQWMADGIARGASAFLIAFGLCGYIAWRDPLLGAAQFALFLSAFALILLAARPYGRATAEQRSRRGSLTSFVADRIAASHTVIALGGLDRELKGARVRTDRMNESSLRRALYSGVIRGVSQAAHLAASLLLLLLAFRQVAGGGLDTHQVVGLLTLTGLLSNCLADLGRAVELALPGRISGQRLSQRLTESGSPAVSVEGLDCAGRATLQLKDVRLPGQARVFSAQARNGDVILLKGPSGAGKSLLMAMIAGLQPSSGQVCARGRSVTHLSRKRRRASLGLAAPYTPLLQDSLKRNLLYRGGDRANELARRLREFELAHFLDGSGTITDVVVRDGGRSLPAAQRQALQIIRAVLGRPSILLLDDVDDALSAVQADRLFELVMQWKGVVILSSRNPRVLTAVNRVWSIDRHAIRETRVAAEPATRSAEIIAIAGERA